MNLDLIDIKLLRLLQENGDLSNKDLALKTNKAITTVHDRIRRMKENGYINRVVAILDRQKIGIGLISFSQVFLVDHSADSLKKFEESVAAFAEVMECFQMSGSYDFLLRVATRDMEGYHMFLRNKLSALPNVDKVQTFFVLSESKFETGYPLSY
ncbi:DNA-binding transcriptional regulator, Lrp family [Sphingobacterium nematocida]|uniref:DNA-binding transcriptional regulator, Lrp family n=1 Tax=Sphingobacterium nematocida TaxID=1513896 RepID=A0A1T5BRX4_9SPHI|nr:Lrp/AsnC family transcriptional regulator [Sphingobacterium nematocida]SKB49879.1 DNA-binding transcriptional regulator, Lrp family [Sphingobacterium nematocida]